MKDNPNSNAKALSYVRAEICILPSAGLSLEETASNDTGKFRMSLVVKFSSRNEGFEDEKRRGGP